MPSAACTRALRVVLVRDRRAEERHDAVAEELVDRALVAVDLGQHQLEARSMSACTSSGSSRSDSDVKPDDVGEQDRDLLALAFEGGLRGEDLLGEMLGRVGLGAGGGAGSVVSAVPQDRQNFLPGVTRVPQLGQAASSRAPQSSQKRAPASFSAWHRGHFMAEPPVR